MSPDQRALGHVFTAARELSVAVSMPEHGLDKLCSCERSLSKALRILEREIQKELKK